MSQYISVYFDNETRYYKNNGLYEIIVFIGKEFSKNRFMDLVDSEAYKKGLKIINSKLHCRHKKVMRRLVYAECIRTQSDYDDILQYPVWKIHKKKAKMVFGKIYSLLKKCDSQEMLVKFVLVCKQYGFSSGEELAGSPYYQKISNVKNW